MTADDHALDRCNRRVRGRRCEQPAAYAFDSGDYYYSYCAEHAEEMWTRNEYFRKRIERSNPEADEVERLPDWHPAEQTLAKGRKKTAVTVDVADAIADAVREVGIDPSEGHVMDDALDPETGELTIEVIGPPLDP